MITFCYLIYKFIHLLWISVGVCLILGPFNYPITLVLSPLMGAIAAGNCAVVKPSAITCNIEKVFFQKLLRYMDNDCIRVVIGMNMIL